MLTPMRANGELEVVSLDIPNLLFSPSDVSRFCHGLVGWARYPLLTNQCSCAFLQISFPSDWWYPGPPWDFAILKILLFVIHNEFYYVCNKQTVPHTLSSRIFHQQLNRFAANGFVSASDPYYPQRRDRAAPEAVIRRSRSANPRL